MGGTILGQSKATQERPYEERGGGAMMRRSAGRCVLLLTLVLPIWAAAEFNPTNFNHLVHYVSRAGAHEAPYTNWANAATNIEAALAVCQDGEAVCVTNGIYDAVYDIEITNAAYLVAFCAAAYAVIDGG